MPGIMAWFSSYNVSCVILGFLGIVYRYEVPFSFPHMAAALSISWNPLENIYLQSVTVSQEVGGSAQLTVGS